MYRILDPGAQFAAQAGTPEHRRGSSDTDPRRTPSFRLWKQSAQPPDGIGLRVPAHAIPGIAGADADAGGDVGDKHASRDADRNDTDRNDTNPHGCGDADRNRNSDRDSNRDHDANRDPHADGRGIAHPVGRPQPTRRHSQ